METTLKKGTRLFAGDQPIELVNDTKVDFVGVAEGNIDGLAEAMSNANHTIYGAHVADLAHKETVKRDVEGKGMCEIDIAVTYGAHGARCETALGEPRPLKAAAPASQVSIGAPRAVVPAASDATANQAANAAAVPSTPSAPVEVPDKFSENFPGYAQLTAAGFTKRSELKGMTVEELESIPGIVPEMARQISTEVNGALTAEQVAEIEAQSRADVEASHAATAEAEAAAAAPVSATAETSAPAEAPAPVSESPAVN